MKPPAPMQQPATTMDFSLIEPSFLALPAYRVRVSSRVRHARLSVDVYGGVEVVVPPRFDQRGIPDFVAEHADWLRGALQRVNAKGLDPALTAVRPAHISLPAIGQLWQVRYRNPGSGKARCQIAAERELLIEAADHDEAGVAAVLQAWLQAQAQAHLPVWLAQLSADTGLVYQKAQIRGQKTKWGSCTSRGVISLNRCLLFLTPPLVRYLLIHELCHTVQLNHSRRYWALVERHEPGYRVLDKALHRALSEVPRWAVRA